MGPSYETSRATASCRAQYCDIRVVNEVVIPLLSMSSSVLLCISTLREGDNHYSKMFQMRKEDGTPLFQSIQVNLVCEACMKTDHPERCQHKMSEMPRWLSSTKMEVVKALLSGDPAMLMRESLGVSAESTTRAFKDDSIKDFLTRPRMDPPAVKFVFVSVDPSGGGESAFAVCSLAFLVTGDVMVNGCVSNPWIKNYETLRDTAKPSLSFRCGLTHTLLSPWLRRYRPSETSCRRTPRVATFDRGSPQGYRTTVGLDTFQR
jgi:hypothetical protein